MTTATQTRSVVVEREMPFPPEKLWRALTQPHLIEEWLMKSDFRPEVGHGFNFEAQWGAVDEGSSFGRHPGLASQTGTTREGATTQGGSREAFLLASPAQ